MNNTIVRLKHWLHEADKLHHMLASLILVQVGVYWLELWSAAAIAFGVGLIKEVGDKLFRAGFSWGDIFANTAGVFLGVILVAPWL